MHGPSCALGCPGGKRGGLDKISPPGSLSHTWISAVTNLTDCTHVHTKWEGGDISVAGQRENNEQQHPPHFMRLQ